MSRYCHPTITNSSHVRSIKKFMLQWRIKLEIKCRNIICHNILVKFTSSIINSTLNALELALAKQSLQSTLLVVCFLLLATNQWCFLYTIVSSPAKSVRSFLLNRLVPANDLRLPEQNVVLEHEH